MPVWLQIVLAVVSITANATSAVIGEWWKARRAATNPTLTPDENQPKDLIQRIGGCLIRLFSSPLWYAFFAALNIFVLLWETRHTKTPVRLSDVLSISLTMGAIYFNITYIAIMMIVQSLDEQRQAIKHTDQLVDAHISVTKDVVSMISRPPDKKPKAPKSRIPT